MTKRRRVNYTWTCIGWISTKQYKRHDGHGILARGNQEWTGVGGMNRQPPGLSKILIAGVGGGGVGGE